MFGIGTTEIIVIFIVALLFLGPKRLPDLARNLGRALADFRRTANDLQSHLNVDVAPPRYSPPPRPIEKAPEKEAEKLSAPETSSEPETKPDSPQEVNESSTRE